MVLRHVVLSSSYPAHNHVDFPAGYRVGVLRGTSGGLHTHHSENHVEPGEEIRYALSADSLARAELKKRLAVLAPVSSSCIHNAQRSAVLGKYDRFK